MELKIYAIFIVEILFKSQFSDGDNEDESGLLFNNETLLPRKFLVLSLSEDNLNILLQAETFKDAFCWLSDATLILLSQNSINLIFSHNFAYREH